MNQQDQGSSPASNVPVKRKRGRPRKEGNVVQVQRENVPAMSASSNMNTNQTVGKTDDLDDEMVGKIVTGVIEGNFNAGYLLKVKVADTDACLRGVVFLPGQVAPVTAENDVAPHVKMIDRKEIPIPVLNPQAGIHGSVPSSVQCRKETVEPELQVPMSEEQVVPTEIHPGIAVPRENQSASVLLPISSGGIPQETPEPGHVNQSASTMSEFECDKTVKQGEILHDLDAATQVKESGTDGGATKDPEPASQPIDLAPIPTIANTDKELRAGQQAVPYVPQLNEVFHDEPNRTNIELNLIPLTAGNKIIPSEQTSKSVDNLVEKQDLPKPDMLEDTKTKLAIETSSEVHTSNTNERSSTSVANIPDVGSSHTREISQAESMPSGQIGESVPSVPKFLPSEGCDLHNSYPQNCSSLGDDVNKMEFNQPTESLANSMEPEKQIGSGTS